MKKLLFGFDDYEIETDRPLDSGPSIFQQIWESTSEFAQTATDFSKDFLKDGFKEVINETVELGKGTFLAWGSVDFKEKKSDKQNFAFSNRQNTIQGEILNEQTKKRRAIEDMARFEAYGMSQTDKNKRLGLNLDYADEHTMDIYHINLIKEDVMEDIEKQEHAQRAQSAQAANPRAGHLLDTITEGSSILSVNNGGSG